MATFVSMYSEVRKAAGDRDDLDTEVKKVTNEAMQDLATMFRIRNVVFSASTTTTAGTGEISLDSTIYDVISVRDDDNEVTLHPGDREEYDNLPRSESTDWGTPTKWLVDGSNLILYNPIPDSAINITYRYIYRLPSMVADADTYPLPQEWERPTKLLAKSYLFEILGQSQEALSAYQQAMAVAGSRHNDKYFRDFHNRSATIDLSHPCSNEGF